MSLDITVHSIDALHVSKDRATPRRWHVTKPLRCLFVMACKHGDVTVPAGSTTDFASTPRALWWLFPPTGRYAAAAVLHDYLYRTTEHGYSRLEADGLLREASRFLGCNRFTRGAMYRAVRMFGARSWTK